MMRKIHGRHGQLAVFAFAVFAAFYLIQLTGRQISYEREAILNATIGQNETRADGLAKFVMRTAEAGEVAAVAYARQALNGQTFPSDTIAFQAAMGLSRAKMGVGAVVARTQPSTEVAAAGGRLTIGSLAKLGQYVLKQRGTSSVSPPLLLQDGSTVIAVTHRLDAQRYSALFLRPERFTEVNSETRFGPKDLVSVIGLDGITRARREGNRLSSGEILTGKLVMQQQMDHPNGNYFGPSGVDGVPRIFSHRRIATYDIFATSGVGPDVAMATLVQRQRVQLLMLGLALIVLVAVSGLTIYGIGQRLRRIAELGSINQRLHEAQAIAGMGDWDYYPASDRLIWGRNLRKIYGIGESETTLDRVREIAGTEEYVRIRSHIDKVIASKTATTYEIAAPVAGGEQSHRRIIVSPVTSADGQLLRIHGIDLSIDNEVSLSKLQASQATRVRLDAMNALTATLAHELNQPLGVASNFIGAAKKRISERVDSQPFQFLERAQEQIDAVAAIVDAARQGLSRRGATEITDLEDAVDRALILHRGHPREFELRLVRSISPDARWVRAEVSLVKQVIHNLIKNALDATPPARQPRIVISSGQHEASKTVELCVEDNGEGLSEGINPFDILRTRKEAGLGLGLALSRTIIESQGGRIWVRESGPEGTTMCFSLPAAEPKG